MTISSPAAAGALRALAAIVQEASPRALLESAAELERHRSAVRVALASNHLVTVASELSPLVGHDLRALEALGVPVDLLDCFPAWRQGSRRPFEPGRSGLRLAPSGASIPLGTVRLQLSPASGTIPYALLLLRDLLQRLDPATRFVVVVEPGANVAALLKLAARFHPSAPSRVRFVHMRCITVFAQDNARAARAADGGSVLLVPRAFREGKARAEDELDPAEAEQAFGFPARRSRLFWEGGNVVHDDTRCFVGVDTLAENAARLGLSFDDILGLFEAEFGLPVMPLGRAGAARFDPVAEEQSSSGQASFHIDLDVALFGKVGRRRQLRALVADAARGLDFVGSVLRVPRLVDGHFLPAADVRRHLRAEYEASAEARHPLLLEYAAVVAAQGYRVVGVPDLRIAPEMDVFRRVSLDFGFCNVLPGLRHARPAVAHFISGIRALDADASRRIRLAGVDSVPVSSPDVASALRLLQGGLHCCCGPM
jgi:hypothetical protein